MLHLQDARRERLRRCRRLPPARRAAARWARRPAHRSRSAPSRRRPWCRASHACRCASTPGNAGSSEGWMLRMPFGKASRNVRPSRRMKPARQTSAHVARAQLARRGRLRTRRGSGSRDGGSSASRCPRARARSSPCASALFDDHDRDLARRSRPSAIASMSACRLLPRPEISTAIRRRGQTPSAILRARDLGSDPGLTVRARRERLASRLPVRSCTMARKRRVTPGGYVYHVCNRGSRKGVIARDLRRLLPRSSALVEEARQKDGDANHCVQRDRRPTFIFCYGQ